MKRCDGAARLATGGLAVSLLLVGCAGEKSEPAATATATNAPSPSSTSSETAEKLEAVTLNVKGMT
jgi:hypothetical protein